jgi:hypothetical protein
VRKFDFGPFLNVFSEKHEKSKEKGKTKIFGGWIKSSGSRKEVEYQITIKDEQVHEGQIKVEDNYQNLECVRFDEYSDFSIFFLLVRISSICFSILEFNCAIHKGLVQLKPRCS